MKQIKNPVWVAFLNLLSIKFKSISFFNLKLKSFRCKRYPEALIVSIDNLSFGGTGKTPLIIETGRKLHEARIKFAIVSRGYKAQYEQTGVLVEPGHSAAQVGDEAKLLKTRFPGSDIFIGRDRGRSIEKAIAKRNRVIILDDGFQGTDIYRDFKIMLFNPFQPYYYLRNFKFLMKKEDYILYFDPRLGRKKIQRTPAPAAHTTAAGEKTSSGKPITGSYYFTIESFYDAAGKIVEPGQSILFGFSGLGDNRRFREDLSAFNLAGFRGFKDHYAFSEKEIRGLDSFRQQEGAQYLVCTEKDYIKLRDFNLSGIPLLYVRNRIVLDVDVDIFEIIQKTAGACSL